MAVTINSSIAALKALRTLAHNTDAVAAVSERLSSGLRINRASDDAAGLAVASGLNASARIYSQGIRNINDAISAHAVAEGSTRELSGILIRLKELATGAANGTYSLTQRQSSDAEADALVEEYNRLIQSTQFNGLSLLNGSSGRLVVQAGVGNRELLDLGFGNDLKRNTGNGSYTGKTVFNGGTDAIASGDVDSDGDLDIIGILSALGTGTTTIRINDGTGNFGGQATVENFGASTTRNTIELADMNGDGKLDIVTGGQSGVFLQLGNGDGTFKGYSFAVTKGTVQTLNVADFNGDGRNDIAYGVAAGLYILTNNGQASSGMTLGFDSRRSSDVSGTPVSSDVGDINGDGILDIIISNASDVSGYFGDGSGNFSARQTLYSGGFYGDMRVADFNDDGLSDIAVYDLIADKIHILNSQIGGTVSLGSSLSLGGLGVTAFNVGDANNDGAIDVFLNASNGTSIFSNDGQGTFTQGSQFGGATFAGGYQGIGDFNGDGVLDFVGANQVFVSGINESSGLQGININTRRGALDSLAVIDATLGRIDKHTGVLGSNQSRMLSALATLQSKRENYQAAEGRIKDADIAGESAALTRAQILQQVGASVLAQANLQPALALKLLQI